MNRLTSPFRLLLMLCLSVGGVLSARATGATGVTLLPQEAQIAADMINAPGQGRPYFVLDPVIEAVARARAKDMAVRNYFSHTNPDGFAANYLLRQAGYQLPSYYGTEPDANNVESIAAGYASSSDTWTAWMNSPPHKEHLMAQNSFFASETHYGVGYYYDPNSTYQYYWVVITAPPEPIAFTTPTPNEKVTTNPVPLAGTTDSSAGASSVQYRVENTSGTSDWSAASGTKSWTGSADLIPGANTIRAQGLDSGGSVIASTFVKVTYVVTGTLNVTTSGSGSVTAGDSGTISHDVGESVTIKATPAAGSIFTGWTGDLTSASATLNFEMQNSVTLQANFEPNPFPVVKGSYYGIVSDSSDNPAGLLQVAISGNGTFSGKLVVDGTSRSFTGALNPGGTATVSIPWVDHETLTLDLTADLTGGSDEVTGSLSDGTDTYSFGIVESAFSTADVAPQAGRYTVVFAPDPSVTGTNAPQGNGFATILVGKGGSAVVAGHLADGTAFSTTGRVTNSSTLAIFTVPSGAPKGSMLTGVINFRATDISDLDGTLSWTKGANSKAAFYPGGFAVQVPAVGARFVKAIGSQTMDVSSNEATVELNGGNLSSDLTVPVVINNSDKATMVTPGDPHLGLQINPVSGTVSGSFQMPGDTKLRPVGGVILQKQQSAYGYFKGISQCGLFALAPGA